MLKAEGVTNEEFLEYKGRPLVRQGDDFYYGDLSDAYYVYMMVMGDKKSPKNGEDIPGMIMVQLKESATKKLEKQYISKTGLAEALEFADAWLTRYNDK